LVPAAAMMMQRRICRRRCCVFVKCAVFVKFAVCACACACGPCGRRVLTAGKQARFLRDRQRAVSKGIAKGPAAVDVHLPAAAAAPPPAARRKWQPYGGYQPGGLALRPEPGSTPSTLNPCPRAYTPPRIPAQYCRVVTARVRGGGCWCAGGMGEGAPGLPSCREAGREGVRGGRGVIRGERPAADATSGKQHRPRHLLPPLRHTPVCQQEPDISRNRASCCYQKRPIHTCGAQRRRPAAPRSLLRQQRSCPTTTTCRSRRAFCERASRGRGAAAGSRQVSDVARMTQVCRSRVGVPVPSRTHVPCCGRRHPAAT